jgi:O-antigen ligase
VIAPFTIFGLQYALKPAKRFLFGFITLILLIGALTTNTRGTFITLIIIIFLMFIRSRRSLIFTVLIVAGSIVFFSQFGFMNALWIRLSPQYLSADPSLWHRILMFWTCTNIFLDYPIFGAGLNSIWELYPLYKHPLDVLNYGVVDNIFLSFLYGTGVVGITIMIGLLSKILTHLLRFNWQMQSPIVKAFRITGCIGILGGLINSLTVDAFDWIYFNLTFWTIIALMIRFTTIPHPEIAKFFRIYGYKETAPELQPVKKPS